MTYSACIAKLFNQQLWIVLICAYVVGSSWRVFLCLKNVLHLRKMTGPPAQFDGMVSGSEFIQLKAATKNESYDKLLGHCIDLGIRVVKLATDYYPYVWDLTASYGQTLQSRAVWFSAIDVIIYEAAFLPVTFVHSLYTRDDPFLKVLQDLFSSLLVAAYAAIVTYVSVFLFDLIHPTGIVALMFLYELAGVVALAFFIRFLENHICRPLPENEVRSAIEKLTMSVGYPIGSIYVDEFETEPICMYYSSLWLNIITISPPLMSELDANQITSFVAHELGHWHYHHALFTYFFHFISVGLQGYLLLLTYGNEEVSKIFCADPKAHPIIPQILAFYYIWKPFQIYVLRGFNRLFKSYNVLVRDDYACRVWNPDSLRGALAKISRYAMIQFPLFDGWYSSWFFASPPSLQRISRILRRTTTRRYSNPQTSSSVPWGDPPTPN